jgi:hypothetical protein
MAVRVAVLGGRGWILLNNEVLIGNIIELYFQIIRSDPQNLVRFYTGFYNSIIIGGHIR